MRLRTRRTVGRAVAAATVVGVIAAPLALTSTTAQAETAKVPPLKVMTRNLDGEDTGLWPSDHAGVMISLRGL